MKVVACFWRWITPGGRGSRRAHGCSTGRILWEWPSCTDQVRPSPLVSAGTRRRRIADGGSSYPLMCDLTRRGVENRHAPTLHSMRAHRPGKVRSLFASDQHMPCGADSAGGLRHATLSLLAWHRLRLTRCCQQLDTTAIYQLAIAAARHTKWRPGMPC